MENDYGSISVRPVKEKLDLTLFDIVLIFFSVFILNALFFALTEFLHIQDINARLLYAYFSSLINIFVPIFYARLRNKNYIKQISFLNKSRFFDRTWLIGIFSGSVLFVIVRLSPYWRLLYPLDKKTYFDQFGWVSLLFVPVTILGLQMVFLGPIGEELMHRGIIFNYLKNHFNLALALLIQAFIFGAMHLTISSGHKFYDFIYYSIIGLYFGFLYSKTNYLLASILSHGIFNYLLILCNYYSK